MTTADLKQAQTNFLEVFWEPFIWQRADSLFNQVVLPSLKLSCFILFQHQLYLLMSGATKLKYLSNTKLGAILVIVSLFKMMQP